MADENETQTPEHQYFVAFYPTSAILGRMTRIDRGRIESTLAGRSGPNGETLQAFSTGTRAQLLEQFAEDGIPADEHFTQADAHPQLQVQITLA